MKVNGTTKRKVSLSEIGRKFGISHHTVKKYIEAYAQTIGDDEEIEKTKYEASVIG
jgi:transposase-like protein